MSTSVEAPLSLYHLLDAEVLANPYPLYHQLRSQEPVLWDPYLHAWVVTRYRDVVRVLQEYSAQRTPSLEQLASLNLESLAPIVRMMVKQMLFLDAPAHSRLRKLASAAFTPQRVATLRSHIEAVTIRLIQRAEATGRMDVIRDLAEPLPYTITAEMLGVPVEDAPQLKIWSQDFAEMFGNYQLNPLRTERVLRAVEEMSGYFYDAVKQARRIPREGLLHSFLTAEADGDRFTDEEVVANTIVTMVGGQETTTNLIANGVLSLLRNADQLALLRSDLSLIPSAVEEFLRYESPSQQTARLAPYDDELGGRRILRRQAVIAVMAAANRDPERFADPDKLDITRRDNRHLAFGWGPHFCFGAALARIEGQIAFEVMLRRLKNWQLEPGPLVWRNNMGLRGLTSLPITFEPASRITRPGAEEQCFARGVATGEGQAIETGGSVRTFPASFAQRQFWARETSCAEAAGLYNEAVTIRIRGALNPAILQRAFAELVGRHDVLRTAYAKENGQLVQPVHQSGGTLPFEIVSPEAYAQLQKSGGVQAYFDEQAARPFDLERGPLFRASLVSPDAETHLLLITVHLSIVDGVSVYEVFPAELRQIYNAFCAGEPSSLPPLKRQFADFAQWEQERQGVERDKEINFWRDKLAGASVELAWPAIRRGPSRDTFCGRIHEFALSPALTAGMKDFSRNQGVTLFITLLAGFTALLHRYTRQEDLVVGTMSPYGRKWPEWRRLIGHFINPVALRLKPRANESFEELLHQAHEVAFEAITHDSIPLETLADEIQPGRPESSRKYRSPFFVAGMSLQPSPQQIQPQWTVTSMDAQSGKAWWDLYTAFIDRPAGLLGRTQYNPELFDDVTIRTLCQDLCTLLEAAIANPKTHISTLPASEASR